MKACLQACDTLPEVLNNDTDIIITTPMNTILTKSYDSSQAWWFSTRHPSTETRELFTAHETLPTKKSKDILRASQAALDAIPFNDRCFRYRSQRSSASGAISRPNSSATLAPSPNPATHASMIPGRTDVRVAPGEPFACSGVLEGATGVQYWMMMMRALPSKRICV